MTEKAEEQKTAEAALEKAVAERRAQVGRTQEHLKAQLVKARRSGLATGVETFSDVVSFAKAATARGLDGDAIAGEMGAQHLATCFWFRGFVPGCIVNSLCAVLSLMMVNRAVTTPKLSMDGDSIAFFIAAILVPLALSVVSAFVLFGGAARLAGSKGYWRAVSGYAFALVLTGVALVLKICASYSGLRMQLYDMG